MWPRRSPGNGGKPSQPQPRLKAGPVAFGRQARRKRTAGRLTKPPPGGRWRACPSADAKAAGFVKRPSVPEGLRAGRSRQAGHRTFGFRTRPAESGISVRAPPPAGKSFGSDLPGRTGLRPGSCETRQDPGFRSMACLAEPRLRPRIPPDAELPASAEDPPKREEGRKFQIRRAANRQGFGPDGEPAGKPEAASPVNGPRRKRRRNPRFRRRDFETAQRGTPRLPGRVRRDGTVGAGGNAGPHYRSGPRRPSFRREPDPPLCG